MAKRQVFSCDFKLEAVRLLDRGEKQAAPDGRAGARPHVGRPGFGSNLDALPGQAT